MREKGDDREEILRTFINRTRRGSFASSCLWIESWYLFVELNGTPNTCHFSIFFFFFFWLFFCYF